MLCHANRVRMELTKWSISSNETAAKAAANKALETDAEECPKGDVAAITDSDIKEYFSDAPEYYAGKKDVYGGRHYHNVYAVFRMTM